MTETWEELWARVDLDDPNFLPRETRIYTRYLKQIKAEGDKLKEKAEKYDALGLDHKYMQLNVKIKTLENKLTKIETLFLKMHEDYLNSRTTPLVSNYIPKFRKILEGE